MKKILILTVIVLLTVLSGFMLFNGLSLGSVQVLSIAQIKEKNAQLDTHISEVTKLAGTDYKKVLSEIDSNIDKLKEEKKNYEDMVTISTSDEVQSANQLEKYEVEYLWAKLGNHATSEGATIKIDVVKGATATQGSYNLQFTATGTYLGITDFIYDIENDSSLGFKIEEFKMLPENEGGSLKATFTCKDIQIKDITITSSPSTGTNNTNTNSTNTNTNSSGGNIINTNKENTNTNTSSSTNTNASANAR